MALFSADAFSTVGAWMSVAMTGAIEVPLNGSLRGDPLSHALKLCKPLAVVADADLMPLARTALDAAGLPGLAILPLPDFRLAIPRSPAISVRHDRHGADIASLLFTSGTSGLPKAAMITEAQAILTGHSMVANLGLGPSDILYCSHPMYHMAAKHCLVMSALIAGIPLCVDGRFDAGTWLDRIRASGATATISHGPMLEMIHAQPPRADDADNPLRRFITSPYPRRISADFDRRFAVRGVEVWGMTELGIPCWSRLDAPLEPGWCGAPVAIWFEMAALADTGANPVADGVVGEFSVRPSYDFLVSPGYFGLPPEDRPDGWVRSGDLGIREDGKFRFVDRKTHRIRRRSENISTAEIEEVLLAHPDITECAVVGVPSGFEGDDDIKIFVVPRAGVQLSPEGLLRFMAGRLPHYMLPRYVTFLDMLPRTPTNKVQRSELLKSDSDEWDRKRAGFRVNALYPDRQ